MYILYFKLRRFSESKSVFQKYLMVFGLFFRRKPLILKYKEKSS